jgi:hypothetical protein
MAKKSRAKRSSDVCESPETIFLPEIFCLNLPELTQNQADGWQGGPTDKNCWANAVSKSRLSSVGLPWHPWDFLLLPAPFSAASRVKEGRFAGRGAGQ